MSVFKEWKATLSGAAGVALLALGWNIYHTVTTDHSKHHESIVASTAAETEWKTKVTDHVDKAEPLMTDYIATKQQVMLNAQAIVAIQTGMVAMQEDLRMIRDYIYGQRPRERRPGASP